MSNHAVQSVQWLSVQESRPPVPPSADPFRIASEISFAARACLTAQMMELEL